MKRLQQLREARGWTRAELARRAKLNPATVGMIEHGRLQPYESQLRKLAAALGVEKRNADQLLDGPLDGLRDLVKTWRVVVQVPRDDDDQDYRWAAGVTETYRRCAELVDQILEREART
jgi:transcriptional regulator with XRE-family HTH domain